MKKINYKVLIISILIPLVFGIIGWILGGATEAFSTITKPFFAPPAYIFPIVWSILYILMGISFYLVLTTNSYNTKTAFTIYFLQLFANSLWTLFFFRLELFLFSFVWIILLIVLICLMITNFYKINQTAGYLQLPYLIWTCFAGVLTFVIFILNK